MARREPQPTQALAVSVMFEPSRLRPACVAQAYEEVVPLTQRTISRAAHIDLARREQTMQSVGRRAVS
jgi:acetyl esterase/lipase